MALVELNVYPRHTTGKNANRRTRMAGRIPAVLYGQGKDSVTIEVDSAEITKAMAAVYGSSVIFSLNQESADDDSIALLREIQRHPVKDTILHIDLFEIPRGVHIVAPVRIEVEGESLAVKRGDANVAQILDSIEVRCLPRELPDVVKVDVTGLELGDRLYVKDLEISAGEIINDAEALVLLLKAPTIYVEEEEVAEGEVAEGEEIAEGEGEAKPEDTEDSEGKDGRKDKDS